MVRVEELGRGWLGVAIAMFVVCASPPYVWAAKSVGHLDQATEGPRAVTVGMYLSDVPEIDLRAGFFAFDAYLWLRWNAQQFAPTGAAPEDVGDRPRSPADTYEVMGVHELQRTDITSRPGYVVFRIGARCGSNSTSRGFRSTSMSSRSGSRILTMRLTWSSTCQMPSILSRETFRFTDGGLAHSRQLR